MRFFESLGQSLFKFNDPEAISKQLRALFKALINQQMKKIK